MLNLIVQVFDYFMKAAVSYAQTPEGEKELQDILDAAEGTPLDLTPDGEPLTVGQVEQAAARVRRVVTRRG